jgi:trimethylamine--corrinoid protein Co-methyltransferase
MLCALCGAETGSGMGLVESCTLLYPEELILDTDMYHRVRILAEGIDLRPEALALEVIAEVGPRGVFLRHRHTRDSLRRMRFSDLTSQPAEGGGYQEVLELAQAKVRGILESHHPEPLRDDQQSELKRILQTADRELGA